MGWGVVCARCALARPSPPAPCTPSTHSLLLRCSCSHPLHQPLSPHPHADTPPSHTLHPHALSCSGSHPLHQPLCPHPQAQRRPVGPGQRRLQQPAVGRDGARVRLCPPAWPPACMGAWARARRPTPVAPVPPLPPPAPLPPPTRTHRPSPPPSPARCARFCQRIKRWWSAWPTLSSLQSTLCAQTCPRSSSGACASR